MAITYQIFPKLNVALILFRGDIAPEDQLATMRRFAAEPDNRPRVFTLFDMQHCRFPTHGYDEMRTVAHAARDVLRGHEARVRTATYAPDDVAFGMTRMLQSLLAGDNVPRDVFRTREEALNFLELDRTHPDFDAFMQAWIAADTPG